MQVKSSLKELGLLLSLHWLAFSLFESKKNGLSQPKKKHPRLPVEHGLLCFSLSDPMLMAKSGKMVSTNKVIIGGQVDKSVFSGHKKKKWPQRGALWDLSWLSHHGAVEAELAIWGFPSQTVLKSKLFGVKVCNLYL